MISHPILHASCLVMNEKESSIRGHGAGPNLAIAKANFVSGTFVNLVDFTAALLS